MDGRWKNDHKLLLGKPEGKHTCGRPKIRWEDNISWDLKEVDCKGYWKTLSQDSVTWHAYALVEMNLWVL